MSYRPLQNFGFSSLEIVKKPTKKKSCGDRRPEETHAFLHAQTQQANKFKEAVRIHPEFSEGKSFDKEQMEVLRQKQRNEVGH
jgi:hypothetical protein